MLLWLNLLLIFFGIGLFGLSYSLFRKSNQDALKRKNILKIIFDVVLILSAILLSCNLFGLRLFPMQSDIAWLAFSLGNIGAIWISDISRKAKYIYITLFIIAGVFIMLDPVLFI